MAWYISMGRKLELKAQRFGMLFVLKEDTIRNKSGSVKWICRCDCGNEKAILGSDLVNSRTKSCGCFKKKELKTRSTIHGLSSKPSYQTYLNMVRRCKDTSNEYYGGRGIKVCDRWLESFENFYNDIGKSYKKGLQLDRIDNDGNYEPSNCRWVTPSQNSFNQRGDRNTSSKYKGVSKAKGDTKWYASLTSNGSPFYLGRFTCEKEAALAYNKKAFELNGEYAYLNKIEE